MLLLQLHKDDGKLAYLHALCINSFHQRGVDDSLTQLASVLGLICCIIKRAVVCAAILFCNPIYEYKFCLGSNLGKEPEHVVQVSAAFFSLSRCVG